MRKMLPAVALVALGLVGCAPNQLIQVPQIEVQEAYLASLTLPGLFSGPPVANIVLNLNVTNPNPVPLRLANITGRLIIDGSDVGAVSLPNIALPARGTASQVAEIALPVNLNTASSFLKIARGQQVTYRLDGQFATDLGPLGIQNFGPFTLSQGQWQQKALLSF